MLMRRRLIERGGDAVDREGVDVRDINTARQTAVEAARGNLAAQLVVGQPIDLSPGIDMTDDPGEAGAAAIT
jgi:hypothetical protein